MELRFAELKSSPVFQSLFDLYGTEAWPKENVKSFGDMQLQILVDNFRENQLNRNCGINLINAE